MYKILICLNCIFLISCSKNKDISLNENLNEVNKEINQMVLIDQQVRKSLEYQYFFFGKKSNIGFRSDYLNDWGMLKKVDSIYFYQYNNVENVKYEKIRKSDYQNQNRKLWKAISVIDSLNTMKLINLTKKYGYPSYERMKKIKESNNIQVDNKIISPSLIFIHSPDYFSKELKKLVKEEYRKGNIECETCSHIFWNLNGRTTEIDFSYCERFAKNS